MPILSFDAAKEILAHEVLPLNRFEDVRALDAVGRVLAEDVHAIEDYPRFDNSSVDGFALSGGKSSTTGSEYRLSQTIAAGSAWPEDLSPGECARVFTGAAVPANAFGVTMVEDTVELIGEGGAASVVCNEKIEFGAHIRRRGSEIRRGDRLLSEGQRIDPGAIGLLALSGSEQVRVRSRPRVAVISTGDELIDFSVHPVGSQIRDTNLPMLVGLVESFGGELVGVHRQSDDRDALSHLMLSMSTSADLIVVSGGVSVGGRDFIPGIVAEQGSVRFHGVGMRPGKPLLFGSVGSSWVLGLPGNPASTYVGAQLFVRDVLGRLMGAPALCERWIEARLAGGHDPCGREDFVRVSLQWSEGRLWARSNAEQASFGMLSLASSDGLARLPADQRVEPGDLCPIFLTI